MISLKKHIESQEVDTIRHALSKAEEKLPAPVFTSLSWWYRLFFQIVYQPVLEILIIRFFDIYDV